MVDHVVLNGIMVIDNSHGPWSTMVHYGHGPWLTMVIPVSDHGPGQQSVTRGQNCDSIQPNMANIHELPWSNMVVHGRPCWFMGDHGIAWSTIVAHDRPW